MGFEKLTGASELRVTPWKPSHKAVARVRNPLPAPTTCPYCGSKVEVVENKEIYGRNYGEWPWAYRCTNTSHTGCDAHVGMHPFTNIPLGTLANAETREARKQAKEAFNPLWQNGGMSRTAAYEWLANQLGISVFRCHIGWSDVERCRQIIEICASRRKRPARPAQTAKGKS